MVVIAVVRDHTAILMLWWRSLLDACFDYQRRWTLQAVAQSELDGHLTHRLCIKVMLQGVCHIDQHAYGGL